MAFASESPSKPDLRMSTHSRGGGQRVLVASSSTSATSRSTVHHARKRSSSLAVHEAWRSCWWLISALGDASHLRGKETPSLILSPRFALASVMMFCGNKLEFY